MANDELLRRLDLIQATLQMAFASELDAARTRLRADDVSAAILDLSENWIGSTDLQAKASRRTKKSARSVRDRLPELGAQGVLEARGTERRMEYRRTGLA